jgi:hypothetical protein
MISDYIREVLGDSLSIFFGGTSLIGISGVLAVRCAIALIFRGFETFLDFRIFRGITINSVLLSSR